MKFELVGNDSWNTVGKCWLCNGENQVRLIRADDSAFLLCVDCIQEFASREAKEVKAYQRSSRRIIAMLVFTILTLIANAIFLTLMISGGS